ncbi:GNAT family N-acetyltransferase [Pasteurella oralis]|uniref:GNAT family N-acetyltransferase n=1 Tax=Pasteurella oralis TaxID=1071947 RepID=A0ABW4NY88_9PAST|nr:GNAT family N-acetyltransferase [Pasteurella oralis]MDO5054980.1 GNAT family N-acetyltransferase [Pasteurella oralis]
MQIQHQQTYCEGEFFLLDKMGNKAAQLTYFFIDEKTINANHTYVSPTLRGQGVAEQLYQALVRFVDQNQLHLIPTCSYIVKKWQRDNR